MIWGHHRILAEVDTLFPQMKPYKIGSASADVRIGETAIQESGCRLDLSCYSEENPYIFEPGEFLLVAMFEYTVVPRGTSCLFLLKSTCARQGFSHSFAGWIDPGWNGILTMELKNYKREKALLIWPGMPIGQLVYMETPISGEYKGRYQHSRIAEGPLKEIDYNAGD